MVQGHDDGVSNTLYIINTYHDFGSPGKSADNHSQYTLTQSFTVSCSLNGKDNP